MFADVWSRGLGSFPCVVTEYVPCLVFAVWILVVGLQGNFPDPPCGEGLLAFALQRRVLGCACCCVGWLAGVVAPHGGGSSIEFLPECECMSTCIVQSKASAFEVETVPK